MVTLYYQGFVERSGDGESHVGEDLPADELLEHAMFEQNIEEYAKSPNGTRPELVRSKEVKDDDLSLVDLSLTPYGDGQAFYVLWEVRPKNPRHAVWRAQVRVQPERVAPVDYNILAHDCSSQGIVAPAGLLIRGESKHLDVPPRTNVRIEIFGQIQLTPGDSQWYSICRTIISGEDKLEPCDR